MSAQTQPPPRLPASASSVSEGTLESVEENPHVVVELQKSSPAVPVPIRSTVRSQTYPTPYHQHHNHVVYPAPLLAMSTASSFYPTTTHHNTHHVQAPPPMMLVPHTTVEQHPPQHLPLYQEDWWAILTRLQHQVEFYFGLDNLMRDDYLIQALIQGKGTVSCHMVGRFPRVVAIVGGVPASPHLLGRALCTSQVVRVYGTSLVPLTNALQIVLSTRNPIKEPLKKQHSVTSATTCLTDDATTNSVASSCGVDADPDKATTATSEPTSKEEPTKQDSNRATLAAPSTSVSSSPVQSVPYGYTVTTTGAKPRYAPNAAQQPNKPKVTAKPQHHHPPPNPHQDKRKNARKHHKKPQEEPKPTNKKPQGKPHRHPKNHHPRNKRSLVKGMQSLSVTPKEEEGAK